MASSEVREAVHGIRSVEVRPKVLRLRALVTEYSQLLGMVADDTAVSGLAETLTQEIGECCGLYPTVFEEKLTAGELRAALSSIAKTLAFVLKNC